MTLSGRLPSLFDASESLLGASESKSEAPASIPGVAQEASHFEAWYQGYPRHRCKQDALTAYRAALRKGFSPDQLDTARDALIAEARAAEFWPYPATFLRRHLSDYLDVGREEATATARGTLSSPPGPSCPDHPSAACLWSPGAGWIHQETPFD